MPQHSKSVEVAYDTWSNSFGTLLGFENKLLFFKFTSKLITKTTSMNHGTGPLLKLSTSPHAFGDSEFKYYTSFGLEIFFFFFSRMINTFNKSMNLCVLLCNTSKPQ